MQVMPMNGNPFQEARKRSRSWMTGIGIEKPTMTSIASYFRLGCAAHEHALLTPVPLVIKARRRSGLIAVQAHEVSRHSR